MATILIIEDNKELQDLYSEIIEEHGNGYKVILADDGQTALEIARETPIDLVISDMNMPGMTGVGFLSMFRMKSKSTPVIIITGLMEYTPESFYSLGASRVFEKPIRPFDLLKEIDSLLALEQTQSA